MDQRLQAEPSRRDAVLRRYNVERSCLKCHERKIRCDRRNPCTSCMRLNIQCRYPGPERGKRRQQQKAAISDRLAQLERIITTLSQGQSDGVSNRQPESPLKKSIPNEPLSVQRTPTETSKNRGLLLPDRHYINDQLLSRLLANESELQTAMGSAMIPNASDPGRNQTSSANFNTFLFGGGQSAIDLSLLHPSRSQILRLWQVYLTNVNLMIKILHVPTVQSLLFAAINDVKNIPHDLNALLFSIYYSAISSLEPESVFGILNQDRPSALRRFQKGIEMSLAKASFLELPTVTSLQAFVMFLMAMRVHNKCRLSWTLASLATRLAQSIGLHRDGKNFNLSLLETETRRRLWWQIVNNEHRAIEDHGIAVGLSCGFSDTEYPLHINDTDISASSTTPPSPRREFCDMTTFLIATTAGVGFRNYLQPIIYGHRRNSAEELHTKQIRESLINDVQKTYMPLCDYNIPTQRSAYLLARVLLAKLEFLENQHLLALNAAEDSGSHHIDERSVALARRVVDPSNLILQDELLVHFHWHFLSYTQYSVLTYIFWNLCVNPTIPDADSIWNEVNLYCCLIESKKSTADLGPKWPLMVRLREKALSIKEQHMGKTEAQARKEEQKQNNTLPTPLPADQSHLLSGSLTREADFLGYINWDISSPSTSDWANFTLNLDKLSYEVGI